MVIRPTIIGLTDLSARVHINRQLSANLMTFTVPLEIFDEMEGNVEGSFLERHTWESPVTGEGMIEVEGRMRSCRT